MEAAPSSCVLRLFLGSSFCTQHTSYPVLQVCRALQGEILIVRLLSAESGTQVSLEEKYKLQRVELAAQSGSDTLLLLHNKQEGRQFCKEYKLFLTTKVSSCFSLGG